jgi:sulfur-oxidizing protein SoxY
MHQRALAAALYLLATLGRHPADTSPGLCGLGAAQALRANASAAKALVMHPPLPPHSKARRHWLSLALAAGAAPSWSAAHFEGDPLESSAWPGLKREHFGRAKVVFDDRVKVLGPGFAEDPMNVPISVLVQGIAAVQQMVVLVDRNPIRKVLEYTPNAALPNIGFRFKLEQTSPVRAAVRTADGVWHVGGTRVESSGGGCTASGETRRDGSWSQTLGQASAKVFPMSSGPGETGSRLRLKVMHPMDTGLVAGVPAFYVKALSLRDGTGAELARLSIFEPVSENPVFSFDFATPPRGPLSIVGNDNNLER